MKHLQLWYKVVKREDQLSVFNANSGTLCTMYDLNIKVNNVLIQCQ